MTLREVVFTAILVQFLSVNLFYLTLWISSLIAGVRFIRRSVHTNFSRIADSPLTVPITVVFPAFNERGSVLNALYSVLYSTHPALEVILVDDGSTDGTLQLLQKEFDLQAVDLFYPTPLETAKIARYYRSPHWPQLTVIEKENGGKADAINAGINVARYRFVMMTDTDTIFHPDAMLVASNALNQDPGRIVGVGGQLRVKNGMVFERGRVRERHLPDELVARFQQVEYAGAFLGNRVGWNVLNGTPVLSGALSIWRRDILLEAGGMSKETTHEDIEMTLHVHAMLRERKQPYAILSLPDAIVWTEVPIRWRDIYQQRKRWQRVVYEVCWRYKRMIFNPRYGAVGLVTMPYLTIYEAIGPWIETASYLIVFFFLFTGTLSVPLFLLFLLVSFGLSALQRVLSVLVDYVYFNAYPPRSLLTLVTLALSENLLYRPVILVARMHALFEFFSGKKTWERMKRVDH